MFTQLTFALRAFDSGIDAGAYEFGSSFVTVEDVLLKDKNGSVS